MIQFKYICPIQLDFNLNATNAKLAEQHCNFEARITTVDLIQKDYHVKVISYKWYFATDHAKIIVISDHRLNQTELNALQKYTRDQVSDGGADIAAQDFAEVRNNQSVNPDVDLTDQFGPNADYDIITIENGQNDFKFKSFHH